MKSEKTAYPNQLVIKCNNCKRQFKAPVYAVAVGCPYCGAKVELPQGNMLYGEKMSLGV